MDVAIQCLSSEVQSIHVLEFGIYSQVNQISLKNFYLICENQCCIVFNNQSKLHASECCIGYELSLCDTGGAEYTRCTSVPLEN